MRRRRALSVLVGAALSVYAPAQSPSPVEPTVTLERRLAEYAKLQKDGRGGPAGEALREAMRSNRELVESMLKQDKLRSGRDFYLASSLYADFFFFETLRVNYELLLVGAVLGDNDARTNLPTAWDRLQFSMGNGQRFGTAVKGVLSADQRPEPFAMSPVPAPDAIRSGWLDRDAVVAKAKGAKDNPALQDLAAADQEERANFKPDKVAQMIAHDRERRGKALEIIKSGGARTANDYFNAGLIMQHGETLHDFSLAHECGVLAAGLGHPGGPSLCSVSYDRMLLSAGHRQRFGTQMGPMAKLVDATHVSAMERRVLMARG